MMGWEIAWENWDGWDKATLVGVGVFLVLYFWVVFVPFRASSYAQPVCRSLGWDVGTATWNGVKRCERYVNGKHETILLDSLIVQETP
jgi:hypothetical protein